MSCIPLPDATHQLISYHAKLYIRNTDVGQNGGENHVRIDYSTEKREGLKI